MSEQKPEQSIESRKSTLAGILLIVLCIVVLQLWLLMATMNAYLLEESSVIWPAFFASLLSFSLAAGLYKYIR